LQSVSEEGDPVSDSQTVISTMKPAQQEMYRLNGRLPKVFVIILNWNGFDVTCDCLRSLASVDYSNMQVVVVDNGSTDCSADRLQQQFGWIRVIRNSVNLGFTGGNNCGIRAALDAEADYILLLNNDTVVAKNFLLELIEAAEADRTVGLLNPKILYFEPADRIWYGGGSFSFWKGIASHRGHRALDQGAYDVRTHVTFITGCAFLIKAETVRKVGMLDDMFFYTCEDTDWSIRCLRAGYKALYVPSATVWHKESIDIKRNAGKAFRDFYNVRNSILLARKHARIYHWPSFLLCFTSMVAYRIAGYSVRGELTRVKAVLRGILKGVFVRLPASEKR
jgi:GT2 family glycosyltransferase